MSDTLPGPAFAADAEPEGAIDAHVHVWTPDVARYPLASGFTVDKIQPPSFTPEELLAQARPAGVSRIVLIQMSFYRFDNRYMLETIARFPGVFRGVAIVDDKSDRPQDAMRELAKQGVRGFRITPGSQPLDAWLGSPGMDAMWKCAADDGLSICPLVNPHVLPALERKIAANPKTRVVLDHFARVGISGEIVESELDALCALAKFPQVHVKVSAFYALGRKAAPYSDLGPMIRRVLDAFGRERLMWASDSPFQVQSPHTYIDSIELIRSRLDFLTAEDRAWLLRRTAEKVFFG